MAGVGKRPYSRWAFHVAKLIWALGERILRVLLLNRCAPRVAGVERDMRYVFGGHRLQAVDAFLPLNGPPHPVLVYIHGGGFHFGDKRTYDRICRSFAAAGCLVFNVNYRMAPRWGYPEQLRDVCEAVRWAYANAAWFGGDPRRIFLAGDSAGAYFAAQYAVMALDRGLAERAAAGECVPAECLRGLLLFYGAFDFESVQRTTFPFVRELATGFLGQDPEEFSRRTELLSPLRHVSRGFPPCFLATSEIDPLHPESLALLGELKRKGAPCRLLVLSRKDHPLTWHGFLNFWWTRGARRAMREALDFMKENR